MNDYETMSLRNSPKPVQQQRPDWRDANAHSLSGEWTGRRWAWEFLRRNPNYQAVSGKSMPGLAAEFGVALMKPHQEDYTSEMESSGFWAVERLRFFRSGTVNSLSRPLAASELALVFDLEHINKMGQAAIHVMLAKCKQALEEELLRVTVGRSIRGPKIREQFVEPGRLRVKGVNGYRLLHLLRLLDATQKNASDHEIIATLYPQYAHALNSEIASSHELAMAREKMSEDKKTAFGIMESGYLELIPRDYIQNRRLKRE